MQTRLTIKDFASDNKPRERMLNSGPGVLSDVELLAILLRSGGENNSAIDLANLILKKFDGISGLYDADIHELMSLKDIGLAKAASIIAAREIAMRMSTENSEKVVKIGSPEDVFKVTRKFFFKKSKEHLYVLSLDARKGLISIDLVSIGTLNEALIHPREVFKIAFAKNAAQIILIHNHPSNDPSPSDADIEITKKIKEVGNSLGVALLDHVVVSDNKFKSIVELA